MSHRVLNCRRGFALLPPLAMAKSSSEEKGSFQWKMTKHPALKYGLPESSRTAATETFVLKFDYRTRNPQWVLEILTNESVRVQEFQRDKEMFHEDKTVPERMRNKLRDFKHQGYDRGHMAPARDCTSEASFRDSFNLLNIAPQNSDLNRGIWSRFEHFVRGVVLRGAADEVRVVTGPLFLPTEKINVIGDIHVPTHFYKVVLAETRLHRGKSSSKTTKSIYAVGCFVMPNTAIADDVPLTNFVAPLDALESAAGVIFFPQLLDDEGRRAYLRQAEASWVKSDLLLSTNHHHHHRNNKATSSTNQSSSSSKRSDISHLCDRHRCELVTARWLATNSWKKKKNSSTEKEC